MFKLNLKKSEPDSRDIVLKTVKQVVVPETYDLRKMLFPVANQGNEGSCSAYTAACIKEYHEHLQNRKLIHMSTDYIYSQRAGKPEEGMTPKETMEILYKQGSLPSSLWKSKYNSFLSGAVVEVARNFKISGYGKVTDLKALKQSILNYGVGYFAIPVYNSGSQPWVQNPGEELLGGHAIAVVGWTKEGFILRNSWGEEWGDQGYTIFPFSDWGKQWEAWFAIDAETKLLLKKNGKPTRLGKKVGK